MLDHMGFRVRDLGATHHFYEACAAPLRLAVIDNSPESFLIGGSKDEPLPFIWIGTAQPTFWTAQHTTSTSPIHVAFSATDRGGRCVPSRRAGRGWNGQRQARPARTG